MSRLGVISAIVLMAALLGASAAFARQAVTLPGGMVIRVRAAKSISSASAHKGELLEIRSVDPVVLNGWIVVPENARGQAEVADAQPAGKHGQPGKLALRYDWIYSADHQKVHLSDIHATLSGHNTKSSSPTETIAGPVLLGPVGLFAHNFVKGHDAVLDSSKLLTCVVDHTVHVHAAKRSTRTKSYNRSRQSIIVKASVTYSL